MNGMPSCSSTRGGGCSKAEEEERGGGWRCQGQATVRERSGRCRGRAAAQRRPRRQGRHGRRETEREALPLRGECGCGLQQRGRHSSEAATAVRLPQQAIERHRRCLGRATARHRRCLEAIRATRDRSPTCVESWQRAPRPGGAGCRSCAPLAVGCSEGRSGGAGQHRC